MISRSDLIRFLYFAAISVRQWGGAEGGEGTEIREKGDFNWNCGLFFPLLSLCSPVHCVEYCDKVWLKKIIYSLSPRDWSLRARQEAWKSMGLWSRLRRRGTCQQCLVNVCDKCNKNKVLIDMTDQFLKEIVSERNKISSFDELLTCYRDG